MQVAITDEAGGAVDISTAQSIQYGIYEQSGLVRLTKTLGAGITVATNIATIELLPTDTADLLGGSYHHELEIITAAGRVNTVLQGTIILRRDYIKRGVI